MGESNVATQDSPQTTGQTPESPKASTSKETTTTYTEEQVKEQTKKAVSDALAKAGRDAKSLERWQKSLEDKETQIANNQSRVAELQKDLEELAQDDPDRKNIITKIKTLQDKEAKLSADQMALEEEKTKLKTERESLLEDAAPGFAYHLETSVFEMAEEYDGGDAERLKKVLDTREISIKTKTEMEAALKLARRTADALWTKKSEKKPEPLIDGKPDSGATSGGSGKLTPAMVAKMSSEERFKRRKEIAELPLSL